MSDTRPSPPPPRRRRLHRTRRALFWTFVPLLTLLAVLIAAIAVYAPTQSALELAIAQIERASEGRLKVIGAKGALTSTIQVAELRWQGPEATLVAREVALDWRPTELWSRRFVVRGLGAQSLSIEVPGRKDRAAPPVGLVLPLEVALEQVGVGTLDWVVGERRGRITGLTFGYEGGASEHRVRDLALVFERGKLSGDATLGATAPFAAKATLALVGDDSLANARADAVVGGTLERLAVDAQGSAADARFTAHADITPFAPTPVATLAVDARDLNLAALDARWPVTALGLVVAAKPAGNGFGGTLALTNGSSGSIDAGRVPLSSLTATFVQTPAAIVLDDIVAALPGGGRATGRGRIALAADAPMSWSLAVQNLNLRQIHAKLAATQLTGTLQADVDARTQRVTGDIADRALGVAVMFAATVADRRVDVSQARIVAGGGTLEARGSVAFDGERAFAFDATAKAFDPARFGAFPAGSLEGTAKLAGVLAPAWRVRADVALAPGSKLAGLAAGGNVQATLTPGNVRDAMANVQLGAATLTARGNAGQAGDRIEFAFASRNVAELAPLLPAAVPRPLAGALRAEGTVRAEPGGAGIAGTAHADNLKVGTIAAASVDLSIDVAAGGDAARNATLATRALAIDLSATQLTVAATPLKSARITLSGTLGRHALTAAAAGDGFAVDAAAHGAMTGADPAALAWSGVLDTVDARGNYPFRLSAPAPIDVARGHLRIGTTEIALADGRVRLADFIWDEGRVTTHGAFDGVPLTGATKLAGIALPLASDMTLAGEWSLAATPRLSGTINIRRERGDLYGGDSTTLDVADLTFGIRTLALDARVRDDAVDAAATFRSQRGGSADATFALAAGPSPGHIDTNAPMTLALRADLASLAPLQPWLGTLAVLAGRARIDMTGTGTLAAPRITGTFAGDDLQLDAPQYGIHLTDGRLRASLADNAVSLDDFTITGGAGRFTARGTLARVGALAAARVTWRAEDFRVLNRPDLRLVVDGDGTLAIDQRKLVLSGNVVVDEGRLEYEKSRGAVLGDDVVVKGRPKGTAEGRTGSVPLILDLDVDLGRQLRFEGEGLETGLTGRVRVTTGADGRLQGRGTIRAVNGTYYAFGQKLTIDRGRLIFDGPLDNPALDVVALRKNLAVEAGVELTGTVKVPQVRLTSNPPVPDGEKLSWLITGQGVGRGSGADAAALSAASAALLGTGKPIGAQIAQQVGLDDISIRGASSDTTTTPTSGQVVAFGKRLTDRLTLVYEQGLTIATNALRLEYALTRTLTLRVEAGTISGFGIYYRRAFD